MILAFEFRLMEGFSPLSVVIIGAGNLAWSLVPCLRENGIHVSKLISRSRKKLVNFALANQELSISQNPEDIPEDTDIILLCIPDDAIEAQVALLPRRKACLAHCSGSTSMKALRKWKGPKGVFYPLQMFTQEAKVDFKQVPVFIEGKDQRLERLAESISYRWERLDSEKRLLMHMGAVIAVNFSNYMLRWSSRMAHRAEMDFAVYIPLIREHIERALSSHPAQTQTGPAVRGDKEVIRRHLDLLEDENIYQELYQKISEAINPELFGKFEKNETKK